jgi:hypothetical protein
MSLSNDLKFSVNKKIGPDWPVVKQGPSIKLPASQAIKKEKSEFKTCIVLPDMQCGYFRDVNSNFVAIHDEAAIDLVVEFIKETKPDVIAMNGDNADFAEFGKYRLTPAYQLTTQKTIDYLTQQLVSKETYSTVTNLLEFD